jgi:hypothetical protein
MQVNTLPALKDITTAYNYCDVKLWFWPPSSGDEPVTPDPKSDVLTTMDQHEASRSLVLIVAGNCIWSFTSMIWVRSNIGRLYSGNGNIYGNGNFLRKNCEMKKAKTWNEVNMRNKCDWGGFKVLYRKLNIKNACLLSNIVQTVQYQVRP